ASGSRWFSGSCSRSARRGSARSHTDRAPHSPVGRDRPTGRSRCVGGRFTSRVGANPRPYRKSLWRRTLNSLVRPLARLGLTGPRTHVLTVPGRVSGRLWSTPVSIVRRGDERWLVAPYGDRNWVKNARATGWIELRR